MSTLFITGASGFIGRALISEITRNGSHAVIGLSRQPPASDEGIRWLGGDLLEPASYRAALAGADTVIHLAAVTGRAAARDFSTVNVTGTERLLRECSAAGVSRFLFVSSIAARFGDTAHYPYAWSKQQAEARVSESGLRTLVLRPTMVLGAGSPVGRGLRALALAPVVPVFGDGRVRVQPVHVSDVAAVLGRLVAADRFHGETLELGGAGVLSMEELLRRIHQAARSREPGMIHLPVHALRAALALLERVILPPLTAGQLASFCNDGTAGTDGQSIAPGHRFRSLDQMIAETAA